MFEAEADVAVWCHFGPRGAASGHSGPARLLLVTAPSSICRFSKSATTQRRDDKGSEVDTKPAQHIRIYQLPAAVHVDLNDQLAGSITGSKERGNRRRHNAEQQKNDVKVYFSSFYTRVPLFEYISAGDGANFRPSLETLVRYFLLFFFFFVCVWTLFAGSISLLLKLYF